MKLVIAATGASGAIYMQRLLAQIDCAEHEVHLVMSTHAKEVAKQEIDDFKIPPEVSRHSESDMNVPFVSGSARFDAMVIVTARWQHWDESLPVPATAYCCAQPMFS